MMLDLASRHQTLGDIADFQLAIAKNPRFRSRLRALQLFGVRWQGFARHRFGFLKFQREHTRIQSGIAQSLATALQTGSNCECVF